MARLLGKKGKKISDNDEKGMECSEAARDVNNEANSILTVDKTTSLYIDKTIR